jgi:[protein-PII] uridylyltransferase
LAKNRLTCSLGTRQWIRHHRNRLDTAAEHPEVRDGLLELIRSDQPDLPVFRRFYNYGLLRCLIPEMGAVHALVQHDAFHVYPVHEHHLRALTEAKKLMAGDYAEEEPEITRIAREELDREPAALYLACLLHDIGKTAETEHARHGAEMIPAIASRLSLEAEDTELLRFLVAQHTLLMDSASRRDLADEEMIGQCARIVDNMDRLNALLVLSCANMNSIGPKAAQQWRDTPVLALYERIRHRLEKGEPGPELIQQRMERMRRQVAAEVADLMSLDELEERFNQLPPRYLLSVPVADVASHLRLEAQFERSGEPLGWEVSSSEGGISHITVVSREMAGLLARTAGVLTLHDLNITGAQAFTKNNGVVLLVFQCHELAGRPGPDWSGVRTDIRRMLEGKLALDYRIAAHTARRNTGAEAKPVRSQPSEVLVDNDSSSVYTILEVYTPDRVGVLYTMARTLMDLRIRIHVAKVSIKADLGANVFYVKTFEGEKVTDPEQVEELRNALLFYLDESWLNRTEAAS